MGGLEGVAHQTVCRAVAESLGKYQPIAGYGMVAPFCEKVCWHSCHGDSHAGGMEDGFASCPSEGCAQDSCLDFLLRECPPVTRPLSPPPRRPCSRTAAPARLPPRHAPVCRTPRVEDPRPPPPPPPPAPYFQQRGSDAENDYDPDCEIVSYATCRGIVSDYAAEHGTADVLRVSFAPCEGTSVDQGCFRVRIIVVQLPHP